MEAAMSLFAERGADDVSLAEIAKRAKVSQGLIIYHFKSKANLLFVVARVVYSKLLRQSLEAMSLTTNPLDALYAFIDTFFILADNNRDWPVFLAKFNPILRLNLTKFPEAELIFLKNQIHDIVRYCLIEGININMFKNVPVDPFSYLILSMLWGVCRAYIGEVNSHELSNEIKEIITHRLTGTVPEKTMDQQFNEVRV